MLLISYLKVTKMYPGKPITKKLTKMSTGKPITNFFRVNQLGLINKEENTYHQLLVFLNDITQI